MPVMDGLKATRLIRSFEETGNWDAAMQVGIEPAVPSSDSILRPQRMPIIAVSTPSKSGNWHAHFLSRSLISFSSTY